VTLCLVGVACAGCGSGERAPDGGPPGALQTVQVGSLQVGVTSTAGFKVLPLTSSGPVGVMVLYGSTIRRLQELGYNTIAFSRQVPADSTLWNIWLMNADGSNQRRLTHLRGHELAPSWSPDGKRIAFARYPESGDSEIYVMNANGTGLAAVTKDTTDDDWPAWSPDGTRIAYTKFEASDSEIYVSNVDGSGAQNLTNNTSADTSPSWCPDGRQIVYSHHDGDDTEIYVMDATGGNKMPLTSNSIPDDWPAWSPDGSKIAWAQGVYGVEDLYVMNADGSGAHRLMTQQGGEIRPRWSPDGRRLTYECPGTFTSQVWRVDANGSGKVNLSLSKDDDKAADWCPTPSVMRTLIGARGTDGGGNPPFGASRPIAMASLGPEGLVSSASMFVPTAAQASIQAAALKNVSTELAGLKVTASQVGNVLEDRGRGLSPRVWSVAGSPRAGAVLILFSVDTGKITTVLVTADQALAESDGATTLARQGNQAVVSGRVLAALDARDPSRNLAPEGATEALIDSGTGRIISVR
jgi:hypothetical protein